MIARSIAFLIEIGYMVVGLVVMYYAAVLLFKVLF